MYPVGFVVYFVFLQCVCLHGQTIEDANRLHGYLFNNSRYNINVRPTMNQSLPIKISVVQVLRSVESLDISNGFLEVSGYLHLTWQDDALVWNPASYSGIHMVHMPEGSYWKPEVNIYGISGHNDPLWTTQHVLAVLNYTGQVTRFIYDNMKTKCKIDTSLFPFDSHECIYQLYFPKYLHYIEIQPISNHIQKFEFTENLEWDIKENSSAVVTVFDATRSFRTSRYESRFVIKRRPIFILLHQFLPSFILVILNLLTSIVPLNSGERLSYCVTIFLAFIFLMGTMVDKLPASSLHISISSYAFVIYNILSALTVIWSVICVRLSSLDSKDNPIPNWLQRIVLLNKKKCSSNTVKPLDIKNGSIDDDNEEPMSDDSESSPKVDTEDVLLTWFEVSSFLDKIYFIVFLAVTTLLFMGVLIFSRVKGVI